ncbi:MAG: glycoside hydrolase family 9 protein [Halanaerobiales bacterium]
MIHINQIGYKPGDRKEVLINKSDQEIKNFEIINSSNDNVVFTGELTGPYSDKDSGDTLYKGDFTEFRDSGDYLIKVAGGEQSYLFSIEENIYQEVRDALLKVMYYQRCGIELEEDYAGCWKHAACHSEDAYLYEKPEIHIDTTGGWHDAGDYGKYVVPAAKTVADLLLSYEFFPQAFDDCLNIPESGNGIPDILDEVRVALDWMLKMQADNGGVYHKVTTKNFIGVVMPETSKEKRYIFPISSTATADFAAVMAMAGRVYKGIDKTFSEKAIDAAEKSWAWLINNPDLIAYMNPPGVNTGGYGDNDDRDERFWAAVELYRATGHAEYHRYIKLNYKNEFNKTTIDWQHVGGYAVISYLFIEEDKRDNTVYQYLKTCFFNDADQMVKRGISSGYGISLDRYIWGSNGLLMDQALVLIIASMLDKEKADKYIYIAKNNFNYLLGCNALNQSYLTGFGSNPIMNPHHRPSSADGVKEPVPGIVSGGPNKNLQDEALRKAVPEDVAPARAFIDEMASHSSNEMTTYWNSPAVFVAAYFS